MMNGGSNIIVFVLTERLIIIVVGLAVAVRGTSAMHDRDDDEDDVMCV